MNATSRNIALVVVLALAGAALWVTERRKVDTPASPQAVTTFIASGERELSRLPARFTRMKDEEEIRIGDGLVRGVPKLQGGVVASYLQDVGSRVARGAQRKLPYQFHYLAEPGFVNAFALPGGHIVVGQGLLQMMDSEDELAAVLGHEIEHVDLYHCAERVQVETAMRKVPLGDFFSLPVMVFQSGYSKDQELEADRVGTPLAVKAGYSVGGALRFHEKMQDFLAIYEKKPRKASGPLQEVLVGGVGVLQDYFRTHPRPAERIALVRQLIESNHWDATKPERDLRVGWIFWTERAARALADKRYDVAAAWAERALRAESRQPDALRTLGEARMDLAQFAESAAAYRRLLDVAPQDLAVMRRYADALGAMRQPARALQEFREWSGARATLPQARVEVAGLSAMAGEGASPESVLGQNPGRRGDWEPDWVLRLADWNYRARRWDAAESLLNYLFPPRKVGEHRVSNSLAWVLVERGRLDEAFFDFDANPEGDFGHAVIHWRRLDLDDAIHVYDFASQAQPFWRSLHWVEAFYSPGVTETISEILRAEANLQLKAQSRGKTVSGVNEALGQAHELYAKGDYDAATKLVESALRLDPHSTDAWFHHGEIATRTGNNGRAIADFEKCIALEPHRYATYEALDVLLVRGGQFKRLIGLWSGYIQLEPGDGRGWLGRARNYARAGMLTAAVADADESCRHGTATACQFRDSISQQMRK
jgi:beta-barrel assembly-enhancing protease